MRTAPVWLLVLVASCVDPDAFPEDFLFGVATAGFQDDPGCPTIPASECEDPNSDWSVFLTDAYFRDAEKGLFIAGDPLSYGPGSYELFDEDYERAQEVLGVGAVRLSFEWSRIFPASTEGVTGFEALKAIANPKALEYYHRKLAALKVRGLVPMVTLNHYTLPTWIHEPKSCHADVQTCPKRGWIDRTIITEIAKYSGFVAQEFGTEVDLWATLNEPLAITLSGYLQPGEDRSNPPGLPLRPLEAKAVTMHMIEGHARMYDAVRAADSFDADGDGKASSVGLVYNIAPVYALDPDDNDDAKAVENIHYLYNRLFLDAIALGDSDPEADGVQVKDDSLGNRLDWLGVNYYTRLVIAGTAESILPEFSPLLTLDPTAELDLWDDYPAGLSEAIDFAWKRYARPIYVTENGYTAGPASAPRDPAEQVGVATQTWLHVKKAIDDGADVRGYFWWTLVDNFEWNHGMSSIRMGLYGIDPADTTKKRTLRPIGEAYASVAKARKVPPELAKAHPIE